jgi:hypothetical protein
MLHIFDYVVIIFIIIVTTNTTSTTIIIIIAYFCGELVKQKFSLRSFF